MVLSVFSNSYAMLLTLVYQSTAMLLKLCVSDHAHDENLFHHIMDLPLSLRTHHARNMFLLSIIQCP